MGWLWSACAGLEPASPHYAMRCATSCTIGTISRDCGLSVVTRGELTQRFRLSQAYAYIIPRFSAPKLAKFAKKKAASNGRPHLRCFFGFFFARLLNISSHTQTAFFCPLLDLCPRALWRAERDLLIICGQPLLICPFSAFFHYYLSILL